MIIPSKKHFTSGLVMSFVFIGVLILMSRPYYGGEDAFKAADRLFNSIAKGSSYKIPGLEDKASAFKGVPINVSVDKDRIAGVEKAKTILTEAGVKLSETGDMLTISGDVGNIALAALKDADAAYHDRNKEVLDRYSISGKEALYTWWTVLTESIETLKRKDRVREASFLDEIVTKGVEVGYNFQGIKAEKASSQAGILTFSLVFYVAYTVWWGFAIFFLFEGFGLAMEAGEKKEM